MAQIAACLALGGTDRQIAEQLRLSVHTVRSYAKTLYRRLGVGGRVELSAWLLARLGCGEVCETAAGERSDPAVRCRGWARHVALPHRLQIVAAQAATGLSDKESAERLGLSAQTVRTYVKQVYARLGVHSRTELLFALEQSPVDEARAPAASCSGTCKQTTG